MDPLGLAILAIGAAHCLQIWATYLERRRSMATQDDLKTAVAKAVAMMEKAAAVMQAHAAADADAAAVEAAAADATSQLTAASDALAADLPHDPAATPTG